MRDQPFNFLSRPSPIKNERRFRSTLVDLPLDRPPKDPVCGAVGAARKLCNTKEPPPISVAHQISPPPTSILHSLERCDVAWLLWYGVTCSPHRWWQTVRNEFIANEHPTNPLLQTAMADIMPVDQHTLSNPEPRSNPQPIDTKSAPAGPATAPKATGVRSGHLNLDIFSPVTQNGSFAFDRVLKSGEVHKRTRKTKVSLHVWLSSMMSY